MTLSVLKHFFYVSLSSYRCHFQEAEKTLHEDVLQKERGATVTVKLKGRFQGGCEVDGMAGRKLQGCKTNPVYSNYMTK